MNFQFDFVCFAAVLATLGFVPACLFLKVNKNLFPSFVIFPLSMTFGLFMTVLVSYWFFQSGSTYQGWESDLVSGVLVLNVFAVGAKFKSYKHFFTKKDLQQLFFGFVVALFPTSFIVQSQSTTPFRLGPDGAMYGAVAEHLSDSANQSRIQIQDPNNFYQTMVYEGIQSHHRIGFPLITAFAKNILQRRHSFEVMFMVGSISVLLIFLISLVCLESFNWWPRIVASTTISWNVNLINCLFENQLPQALSIPFVLLGVFLLAKYLASRKVTILYGILPLLGFIWINYNESVLLIGAFLFFLILLRSFKDPLPTFIDFFRLNLVAGCSGLLFWPYTKQVFFHLLHLNPNVGYAQPHWALPSEVLGLGNIYSIPTAWFSSDLAVAPYLESYLFFQISLTALIVFVLYESSLRSPFGGSKILMAIFLCIGVVLLRSIYVQNNYTYMKAYLLFSPVIGVYVFSRLFVWFKEGCEHRSYLACTSFIAILSFSCTLEYCIDFQVSGHRIHEDDYELLKVANEIRPNEILSLSPWDPIDRGRRLLDRTRSFYLSVLAKAPVIIEDSLAQTTHNSQNKILLLVKNGKLDGLDCGKHRFCGEKFHLRNSSFNIGDLGATIKHSQTEPLSVATIWKGEGVD